MVQTYSYYLFGEEPGIFTGLEGSWIHLEKILSRLQKAARILRQTNPGQ